MNKHNEIKWGLIPHSYYNIPTKIYKSFYEQNTEKFLGIWTEFSKDAQKGRAMEEYK